MMVSIVFNVYLNRYGSIWTKCHLKPWILDPNRDIYVNGAHRLLRRGTTRREIKVPSGIAPIRKNPKHILPPRNRGQLSGSTQAELIGISHIHIYIYIYILKNRWIYRERQIECIGIKDPSQPRTPRIPDASQASRLKTLGPKT